MRYVSSEPRLQGQIQYNANLPTRLSHPYPQTGPTHTHILLAGRSCYVIALLTLWIITMIILLVILLILLRHASSSSSWPWLSSPTSASHPKNSQSDIVSIKLLTDWIILILIFFLSSSLFYSFISCLWSINNSKGIHRPTTRLDHHSPPYFLLLLLLLLLLFILLIFY